MIGIDTNVLIRYIVQDDPEQAKKASGFIEENFSKSSPGLINQIVLCEIVWVLKRAYCYEKDILIRVIKQILMTSELSVENSDCAWQALREFEKGEADFSDYLIGSTNKEMGCEYTITFDRNACLSHNFLLL